MLYYFYFKAPQPTNQVKNCEFKHKKQATILIVSLFLSETIQTASCIFITFVLFLKTIHSCKHDSRFFRNFIWL